MAQTISKTGAPVIELGAWVASTGNAEYAALMEQHASQLIQGQVVQSAEFDSMATAFLTATNQEIVDGPVPA
jgi:hypothetical protein